MESNSQVNGSSLCRIKTDSMMMMMMHRDIFLGHNVTMYVYSAVSGLYAG